MVYLRTQAIQGGGERCWCSMLAHARNHGFLWHVQPRGMYNTNEARWFILWQINRKAYRSQASDSHDEPPFSGTGALARMRVVMGTRTCTYVRRISRSLGNYTRYPTVSTRPHLLPLEEPGWLWFTMM